MKLILKINSGFDLSYLRQAFSSQEDMNNVFPLANWPFKDEEWLGIFYKPPLDDKTFSLLFEYEGEEIAHAGLRKFKERDGQISLFFVHVKEKHRGSGLTYEMFRLIEEFIKEHYQGHEYHLNVRLHNARAQKFYKKIGFEIVAVEETRIRMKKVLTSIMR